MSVPASEHWDGIVRLFALLRSLPKEQRGTLQGDVPRGTPQHEQWLVAQSLVRFLEGENDETDQELASYMVGAVPFRRFFADRGPREAEAKDVRDLETLQAFRVALKKAHRALITDEVREWANQITDEEIRAGLEDIKQNGGFGIDDIIVELEKELEDHDRAARSA